MCGCAFGGRKGRGARGMHRRLMPHTLQRINDEFSRRILHSGCIETCDVLSGENGRSPNPPRLRMHYNKKSFGLLRRMIDIVNADAAPAQTLKAP